MWAPRTKEESNSDSSSGDEGVAEHLHIVLSSDNSDSGEEQQLAPPPKTKAKKSKSKHHHHHHHHHSKHTAPLPPPPPPPPPKPVVEDETTSDSDDSSDAETRAAIAESVGKPARVWKSGKLVVPKTEAEKSRIAEKAAKTRAINASLRIKGKHFEPKLFSAFNAKNFDLIDKFLAEGADPNTPRSSDSYDKNKLIVRAISAGEFRVCKALLDNGAHLTTVVESPISSIPVGSNLLTLAVHTTSAMHSEVFDLIFERLHLVAPFPPEYDGIVSAAVAHGRHLVPTLIKLGFKTDDAVLRTMNSSTLLELRRTGICYVSLDVCLDRAMNEQNTALLLEIATCMDDDDIRAFLTVPENVEAIFGFVIQPAALKFFVSKGMPVTVPGKKLSLIHTAMDFHGSQQRTQFLIELIAVEREKFNRDGSRVVHNAIDTDDIDLLAVALGLTDPKIPAIAQVNDPAEHPSFLHQVASLCPNQYNRYSRTLTVDDEAEDMQARMVNALVSAHADMATTDFHGRMAVEYMRFGSLGSKYLREPCTIPRFPLYKLPEIANKPHEGAMAQWEYEGRRQVLRGYNLAGTGRALAKAIHPRLGEHSPMQLICGNNGALFGYIIGLLANGCLFPSDRRIQLPGSN